MNKLRIWLGILGLALTVTVRAATPEVQVVAKEPPAEVGEAIRSLLQSKAIQVGDEGKGYVFWLRRETPLTKRPDTTAKALDALKETTVLGVLAVGSGHRDYKDNEIPAGTYVMRFGLQPQDGDHLGTADYLYFAVLVPAKADTTPEGIKTYKAMVRASGKASAAGHPLVLSLRPAGNESGDVPKVTEPAEEHKAVTFRLPGKVSGEGDVAPISFELVFEGRYKA